MRTEDIRSSASRSPDALFVRHRYRAYGMGLPLKVNWSEPFKTKLVIVVTARSSNTTRAPQFVRRIGYLRRAASDALQPNRTLRAIAQVVSANRCTTSRPSAGSLRCPARADRGRRRTPLCSNPERPPDRSFFPPRRVRDCRHPRLPERAWKGNLPNSVRPTGRHSLRPAPRAVPDTDVTGVFTTQSRLAC